MTKDTEKQGFKVILHAPTAGALERARNNAANLRREDPEAQVRIIINAGAVAEALDVAHEDLDPVTWVCPNTLRRTNREIRPPLQLLAGGAIGEIAALQRAGWAYIRA